MTRKHDVDEINLKIDSFEPFVNDVYIGFDIYWSSDIGFGQYTVYRSFGSDQWYGESECMDRGDDKDFLRKLMSLFIDELMVAE